MNFQDLVNQHVCIALDKQVAMSELLGNKYTWELELEKGFIKFSNTNDNKDHKFAIQILGSESRNEYSWLWSWANPDLSENSKLITESLKLYELGTQNNIRELTDSDISLMELPLAGHLFASIGSSISGSTCYFKVDQGDTFVYLLVFGKNLSTPMNSHKIIANFRKSMKYFPLDHKIALEVYLSHHGYKINQLNESSWHAEHPVHSAIHIGFGLDGTVEKIETGTNQTSYLTDPHQ